MLYRRLLTLILVLALNASACATRRFEAVSIPLAGQVDVGDTYAGIRLLGALRLAPAKINSQRFCGLSGLAWDEDASILYALSDRGSLFHLQPELNTQGHLTGIQVIAAYPLRNALDRPLRPPDDDAEGLAIRNSGNGVQGDTELLVSFEIRLRVVRYSPTGLWRGEEKLPALLRDPGHYRNPNQGLEAITVDPFRGILVGTEVSLLNDPSDQVRLFQLDGRSWNYRLSPAPKSALVAMEVLPDGSLLTLERAFVAPLRPLIISLRRTPLPEPGGVAPLNVTDVAVFDSSQGWLLDNFEGLTRYQDQRFFMISDDNCSAWQSTLLVYFELLPARPAAAPR
ncbi:MAG TPA: esterase-like activity of phytase family protein [Candidatus Competibacteraceae bacterium]|nr:esterase-like activity of phytase family protein [Candidatus Competibacteraceae bacterium]HPF58002.1 esterase-like activity of phytase family protein [Candidatus Competibacteraceae bacterium]HRY17460.1 esterase-like activity of phytase family protein [Candidatus Competibacteraceae bacterium]